MKSSFLPTVFATFGLAVSAKSAVIIADNFDYSDGDLTAVSSGAWTAFSGAGTLPIQVANGSVTVTNVVSGASGEDLRLPIGSNVTTGALYYSALVTPLSAPTLASGDYFFSGYSSFGGGGGYFGRVFVSTTETGFAFGLSNGTSTPVDWTSDAAIGVQYLLVMRLDVEARTATLGVFDPSAPPTMDSQLSIGGGTASGTTQPIDSIALRQGSGGGGFSNEIAGVMVSDSITQVIPEPSVALLGGIGMLALLRRRR